MALKQVKNKIIFFTIGCSLLLFVVVLLVLYTEFRSNNQQVHSDNEDVSKNVFDDEFYFPKELNFDGLEFDLPLNLNLVQENKEKSSILRRYITTDFATSSETIFVQGIPEETEVILKGYRLSIMVSKLEDWQRESHRDLAQETNDRVLVVADTDAYMDLSEGFVTTSLFHPNGKDYTFWMSFPRSAEFDKYEDTYTRFLDSVVIE